MVKMQRTTLRPCLMKTMRRMNTKRAVRKKRDMTQRQKKCPNFLEMWTKRRVTTLEQQQKSQVARIYKVCSPGDAFTHKVFCKIQ